MVWCLFTLSDSLSSLRKRGNIHIRVDGNREHDLKARLPQCPVMFVARRNFLLLREQTKWQGQGAKRPGGELVATCAIL